MTKTRASLNLDRIRRLGLTPDLDGREAREVPERAGRDFHPLVFAGAGRRLSIRDNTG